MSSEWDFTWGLTGQELIDAQSSGATYEEWASIERKDRLKEKKERRHSKKGNTANAENVGSKKDAAAVNASEKQGETDKR